MPASGAPIGLTPFGCGPLTSAPDAATAPPALSRYINPATGDYQFDPRKTGQLAKMPALRQRVLLIVMTRFGSSTALQTLGIRRPPKMDEAFEARVKDAVRQAFRRLTDVERVMRVDAVVVKPTSSGRALVTLTYTDLDTGAQHAPVSWTL